MLLFIKMKDLLTLTICNQLLSSIFCIFPRGGPGLFKHWRKQITLHIPRQDDD